MGKISEHGGPTVEGDPGMSPRIVETDDPRLQGALDPAARKPGSDRPLENGDDDVSTDPGNVTHDIGGETTGDVPGDAPEGGNPPPVPPPPPFDPSEHTVDEVLEYLSTLDDENAADRAEYDRVIDAERSEAGKQRVGILGS